jgi:hypothetical protein
MNLENWFLFITCDDFGLLQFKTVEKMRKKPKFEKKALISLEFNIDLWPIKVDSESRSIC